MKRFFNVKRLLAALLLISLFIPSALAGFGDEPNHSCVSVVNSEKNVAKYKKFAKAGELSILIPALDDMFVPQGMTYYAPENLMFFTGYYGEGYSSTLFAVDMATNEVVKEILLAEVDGSIYDGHAGGVAVTGKNIYISDNNRLYRLPLSDFHNAAPMDVLGFAEAIPVPCEASYCQINNGVLWVGEFYYKNEKKYHTDPSHEVKSEKGTQYNAWLLGYKLVDQTENELDPACITAGGAIPDYILATTDRIQGVTFCDNQIFLSQSYGRNNDSTIYRYKNVLGKDPDMKVQVLGVPRPMWFLDSKNPDAKLKSPPMTEGLCTIGNSVYVSFESAAPKYRLADDASENPVDRVFKLDPNGF